jgi:penicillin amidase
MPRPPPVLLACLAIPALSGCAAGDAASPGSGDGPARLPAETYEVEGLSADVEILVDRWGVPHIYAQDLQDAFFAQGWNAARDRLWQLDLWKRRGDGTLAEAFGPAFVEKDRAARLFLYRGEMRPEWRAYGPDTERVVGAFVEGINAWIRLTRREPRLLPVEFGILDYEPAFWTPETVVRIRSHGLLWNASREDSRARFLRDHGREALALREWLEPPHELVVPDGLDLESLPDGILAVYDLARSGVAFARDPGGELRLAAAPRAPGALPRSASNNWAVAGSRTASGRPILANDPHRALSVPSLRYLVHLSAPGLDAIGAGEPALPGISIGHNGRIAFGLTIFFIDQEDLYVYETHPERPDAIRHRDRWEEMRIVEERIPVRGGGEVPVRLAYTRHGPVIHRDPRRHLAVALRAAWLEPGMAPYLGGLELMRARDWDAFLAAMRRWGLPPENLVYADVEGRIGWKPGGLAPIRRGWDGLLPVPGDGRYEWAGFLDAEALPVEVDPARGWIATANQMNLPPGHPRAPGFEWIQPYRYQRIREVLEGASRVTLDDMQRLQLDVRSVPARRVLPLLEALDPSRPDLSGGLALLRGWDGSLDADSPAAALFEIWFQRHLAPAVVAAWSDDPDTREALRDEDDLYDVFEGGSVEAWLSRLGDAEEWPPGARDAALASSLAAAWEEVRRLLGDDPATWRWGRLHRAHLRHPLSELLDEAGRAELDVGPAPRGGSGATVNSTGYTLGDFVQRWGASFRMVLDVGDWDRSLAMNSPGQSGDPRSPHYRDLFQAWARDGAFPLLYGRERIEAAAERRLVLQALHQR